MRVACLGDSCTFGQNVRQDQAWPHLLWEMTGHDVRNLGVNGDTSRLGLERWHRDVDLCEPDVVVVQFGLNDANLWHGRPRVSRDEYWANIEAMHRLSRIFVLLDPHALPDREFDLRLSGYRRHGTGLEVPLLDDGYGCHPSPEGHQMYAEYVAGLL